MPPKPASRPSPPIELPAAAPGEAQASRVVAIVITYFPDRKLLAGRLADIRDQVDALVVVDNGSSPCVRESTQTMADMDIHWISLSENLGVAKAQNIGIAWARSRDATHVILFDQDSDPAPNMVARLLSVAGSLAASGVPIAVVAANYVDRSHTRQMPFARFRGGRAEWFGCDCSSDVIEIDTAIASGSLIPLNALDAVGDMREELFIDLVDIEWCLRAIHRGFRIFAVCDAVLGHTLGEPPRMLFGRTVTMHKPLRSYYFYRNAIWLFRQGYIPRSWKLSVAGQMLKRYVVLSTLVSPRLQYLRMMTLGFWHGLRGRYGRLDYSHQ
jgi:rhamnosyltransferase